MSVNFEKFRETKIPAKDRAFEFDVRVSGGKVNEPTVDELVARLTVGLAVRAAFVDVENVLIDGRNASEAYTRFLGGDNPLIPVYKFPWALSKLSAADQQEVEIWALKQNMTKDTFRRFATTEDVYAQIRKLVDAGRTDADIRESFRGFLNHAQITSFVARARKAKHDRLTAALRTVVTANPDTPIERLVKTVAGEVCTPAETEAITEAAKKKAKKGPKVKIRAHKWGKAWSGGLQKIETYANLLLDAYREAQDGRSGLSRDGYLDKLRDIQATAQKFENAFAEVIRRGLSEMNASAEELDKPKKRRK